MDTSSSKRMPRKTLCGPNIGLVSLPLKQPLDGAKFCKIPHRCGSSMCINVFDWLLATMSIRIGHGKFHAHFSPHTRGCHHVIPIRVGSVSHEFCVNLSPARLGVLQLLKDDDSSTAGDAESITVLIKGPTGLLGRVIVRCGQGTHTVKHTGKVPIDILSRTTERHIGLVQQNLLVSRTNTMRSSTARTGDGKTHSLNLECRGQNGTDSRSHGSCDTEWSNLVLPSASVLNCRDSLDNVGN
mmetsp:Transcript_29322/g.62315  ORF Transcript_29322/g.62315 Transcript_29322/m.62315 type:complete len:241 (-) Transcript_29322:638-1360(-)